VAELLKLSCHLFDVPLGLEYDAPKSIRELPSTDVVARSDELLRDVVVRALAAIRALPGMHVDPFEHGYFLALRPVGSSEEDRVLWPDRMTNRWFGIDEDGRLVVDDETLSRLRIGDLKRAGEAGRLDGAWDDIVLVPPEGLGAGPEILVELLGFLRDVGVDVVAGTTVMGAGRALGRASRAMRDRSARKVAKGWSKRGITRPYTLRSWIDSQAQWKADEVAERLGLFQKSATELLEALGYEFHEGRRVWILGTTKKARARRRRWEHRESSV
jgi:hypothetical protein